jgi:transcriptional regulator with XRE-family HTH domain
MFGCERRFFVARKSASAENPRFAANLAAIMDRQGINNARLARWLGVSREIVGQWRKGEARPTEDHFDALRIALQCTRDDLVAQCPQAEDVLPITAWARREGIPIQRAKDLFALRILTGERNTPFTTLVPTHLTVPRDMDSKRAVLMAKRRPRWVPIFHSNFPRLVKARGMDYMTIAKAVGVTEWAVSNWASSQMSGQIRYYPTQERLPHIAEALGVPIRALIGDMLL